MATFSRFAVWLSHTDNADIVLACAVAPPLVAIVWLGFF